MATPCFCKQVRPHALPLYVDVLRCTSPLYCTAGPIPFLPDNDILVRRVENQWGPLEKYGGIRCGTVCW